MKKFLCALGILLAVPFTAHSQFSSSEIWARGQWSHVSATSNSNFMIDASNIKRVDGEIYTYMAIVDREKNKYTGPFEFVINCQLKSYKLGTSRADPWSPTSAGGIAAGKLCGDVHQESGDKYEFLSSFLQKGTTASWIDQYWVPEDVYHAAKNPDILIVKFILSSAPPPINFSTAHAMLGEIDCRNLKLRFSTGAAGNLTVDESGEWSPVAQSSAINIKICQNKELQIKQSQLTSPTKAGVSGIDNAKLKCIDLGFKTGSEAFGKCVLQLSK